MTSISQKEQIVVGISQASSGINFIKVGGGVHEFSFHLLPQKYFETEKRSSIPSLCSRKQCRVERIKEKGI